MHIRGQNMNSGSLNPKIIITMTMFYSPLRGPILKNQLELHWKRVHLGGNDDWWYDEDFGEWWSAEDVLAQTVYVLNFYRQKFLDTKDKKYWWQMIQLLPSSYNQKRTVLLNYAVLKNMYFARRHHKLDEWHTLCDWMLTLPYFKEVCVDAAD